MMMLDLFDLPEAEWRVKMAETFITEDNNAANAQYMERFMQFAQRVAGSSDTIVTATKFAQSCSIGLYRVHDKEIASDNKTLSDSDLYQELLEESYDNFLEGIHLFRFSDSQCADQHHIAHFNPELLYKGAESLAIYQEYGLKPENESGKKQLEEALKAEKIKNTLVYACYENDSAKIMQYLENDKLNKAQLNKALELCGTPLTLCAANDNLGAFIAIAEKGADIGKKCCGDSPLKKALNHSYDIVRYIFENYREQFDKEVKGFNDACYARDVRVLQLLKDLGFDLCCAGQKFPPLHTFVDHENPVGVRFLLDNGVDISLKNKNGQTALERAKRNGLTGMIALLENA